jgi:hypothetical protein
MHIVPGTPEVTFFVESGGGRIGLRVPVAQPDRAAIETWAFSEMQASIREWRGAPAVEVSVSESRLFEAFYSAGVRACDLVQIEGLDPLDAMQTAATEMGSLLARRSRLSTEEEHGLWGEMHLLRMLLETIGPQALEAWVGWDRQAHDFRMGTAELEAKTTTGKSRIHRISSLQQLVPSPGRRLFLVSMQIMDAGTGPGESLPGLVADIRPRLGDAAGAWPKLVGRLRQAGYIDADAGLYTERFSLRSTPEFVEVTDAFPRLTPDLISNALRPVHAARITDVQYRVSVDGLGIALDTKALCGIRDGSV